MPDGPDTRFEALDGQIAILEQPVPNLETAAPELEHRAFYCEFVFKLRRGDEPRPRVDQWYSEYPVRVAHRAFR